MGDVPNGNWLIPCGKLQSDGTFTAAGIWNVPSLLSGSAIPMSGISLVQLPTATGLTAPPQIGVVEISGVHGELMLDGWGLNYVGSAVINFGIFVSEYVNSLGKWSMLDPSNAAECSRDEWLMLGSRAFVDDGSTFGQLSQELTIPIALPLRLRLGGGQQLVFVMSIKTLTVSDSGAVMATPNLRTFVRRVA